MKVLLNKPDALGIAASTLCIIHCLITPFIFIAQTCTNICCEESPMWWKYLDFIFLIMSFIAIYYSSKKSTKTIIKVTLFVTWSMLFLLIFNERLTLFEVPKYATYFFALLLSGLHIYNLKYCQCNNNFCAKKINQKHKNDYKRTS